MNDAIVRLAEHHTLSLISARLLDAALAGGRNVLCTGPLPACLPLMTALVAEGSRPSIYSANLYRAPDDTGDAPAAHEETAAPHQAPTGADGGDAPDRLAAWQPQPQQVARALLHHVGVVGHLAAGRLDRCLMRLELALMPHLNGAPAALAVLAAVDLVVVVRQPVGRPPRVDAIYELVMAEEGYRPAPLFVRGTAAGLEALVPVREPSFLADLAASGHEHLAQELQAAAPGRGAAEQQQPPSHPPADGPGAAEVADAPAAEARRRPNLGRAAKPAKPPTPPAPRPLRPLSAPGWELDQDVAPLVPDEPAAAASLSFAEHLAELDQPSAAAELAPMPSADGGDEDTLALEPPPKPRHR